MRYLPLLILVLLITVAIPGWPHSMNWGYGPSGFVTVMLVVYLVLLLTGVV